MRAEALYPPLDEVQARLQGGQEKAAEHARQNVEPPVDESQGEVIEASGLALGSDFFEQLDRLRAVAALPAGPVAAGDIRWPTAPSDHAGIAVLVDIVERATPQGVVVAGWLVVPELSYAGAGDWLLQEDEAAVLPSLSVVQLWHRASVLVNEEIGPAGRVTPHALERARALARLSQAEWERDLPDEPGRFGLAHVAGHDLVTGTALRSTQDPRTAYRALHRDFAHRLAAAIPPAPVMPQDMPALLGRRREAANAPWWQWSMAAALVVSLAANLHGLWAQRENSAEFGQVRSPSATGAAQRQLQLIELHVAHSATVGSLLALLEGIGGRLFDGPTNSGAVVVGVAPEQALQALQALRASPLVERAEPRQ